MNFSDAVSEYLPTKSQKVIWGMTATLSPASMFLYEGLEKVGVKLVLLQAVPIRALLGLGVFSLGMASLNMLLVLHIHAQRSSVKKAASPAPASPLGTAGSPTAVTAARPPLVAAAKPAPEADALKILALLQDDRRRSAVDVAHSAGFSVPTTKYHLDELRQMRLVDSTPYLDPLKEWYIEAKGRACLKQHNLLA